MKRFSYTVKTPVKVPQGLVLLGLSDRQVRRRQHLLEEAGKGAHRVIIRDASFLPGEKLTFAEEPPPAILYHLESLDAGSSGKTKPKQKKTKAKAKAKGSKKKPAETDSSPSDAEERIELLAIALEDLGEAALRDDGSWDVEAVSEAAGFATTAAELALVEAEVYDEGGAE